MTFLEAANKVLARAGRPMTTKEIVAEAVRQRLLVTAGKTPEKTIEAMLYGTVSLDLSLR